MPTLFYAVLTFSVAFRALAVEDPSPIERQLQARYERKVFLVSSPKSTNAFEGVRAWLVDRKIKRVWHPKGRLFPTRVRLGKNKIEMRARRLFYYLNAAGDLQVEGGMKSVELEIPFPKEEYGRGVQVMKELFMPFRISGTGTAREVNQTGMDCWEGLRNPGRQSYQKVECKAGLYSFEGGCVTNEQMSAPKCLRCPFPEYPKVLSRQQSEGVVVSVFVLDREGRVTCVQNLNSPHPHLSLAVVEGLDEWKMEPARRDGVSVPVKVRIETRFQLQ